MAQSEPRNRSLISFIALVCTVITIILAAASLLIPGIVPDWLFPAAASLLGLYYSRSFRSQDDLRQVESRERVRAAEQGLEDALRGYAGILLDDGTVDHRRGTGPRATEPLEDTPTRLALSELWAVTHRRLDHYHGIALGQAKRSFRNAQFAMGLGFALLVGFMVVALNASTTAGSIVAGGLGAVSAALAGYVSRTFIRSQETAAAHLRAYFDQPLEFSRYLAAERLMADAGLSEQKQAEILGLIVQTMIAGPPEPTEPTRVSPDGPTSGS